MKLYRPLVDAVISALKAIFEEGKYADKVIEKTLRQNPKWGSRDRRFIAETTYDIVRWHRLLMTCADQRDHHAVMGAYFTIRGVDLPPWREFGGVDPVAVTARHREAAGLRKLRESVPDWLDDLGERELAGRWESELHALNGTAPVVLRVNTLKTSIKKLQQRLNTEEVETSRVPEFPEALVVSRRQNVFRTAPFLEGEFEVQDAASQAVAPFLNVEPGMRVVDACAGAGGKTLHLAAIMQNKGRLIALDTEQWKLDELKKRARRGGVSNIETRVIDSSRVVKRLAGTADRVLLDVPCSGLGVLRRNPDAKWKLSPDYFAEVCALQRHILGHYCDMLKPGGFLVYATCSILPAENERQVQYFLAEKGGSFLLTEEKRFWPSDGFDGFYMALLQRVK